MLGKLMKHEWKSVYKLGSIFLIAIFAVTLLGCIALRTPVVSNLFSEEVILTEAQSVVLAFMSISSLILYILLLVGAMYGIIIYLGVHFYKTMYTDEGYLTHTLPVNSHQLLISKTLVSGVWVLFVYVAIFVSILALGISMVIGVMEGVSAEINFAEFWEEVFLLLKELDFDTAHYIIAIILTCLITPFSSVLQIFGALTIGQLSKKYKLLMGILTYIGLLIANSIISSVVQTVITFRYAAVSADEIPMGYMAVTYDASLITVSVIGVILYFVSHHIINKKLNMD